MRRWIGTAAVLVVVAGTAIAQAPAAVSPLSLDEYRAQLVSWRAQARQLKAEPAGAARLLTEIPPKSAIDADGVAFESSNAWLKDSVAQFIVAKPSERDSVLRAIELHIQEQLDELDAMKRPGAEFAGSHARLENILARREFHNVRQRTAFEVWRDKLLLKIQRWLDRMLNKVPGHSQAGQVFIWILIAIVSSVLGVWLKRRATAGGTAVADRVPVPFSGSAKGWRRWLDEGHAAAKKGDWRGAVHALYWAGIAYLEHRGAWAPSRARTPREYLRLLPAANPNRGALASLTRQLEATWYGYGSASDAEFRAMLLELEKLGCR